jgi:cation diffusion facilitator CzcD-associated flavoprotein CzcO
MGIFNTTRLASKAAVKKSTRSAPLRVCVVGGGPAGMTLAGILGREAPAGSCEVTVLESGSADRD